MSEPKVKVLVQSIYKEVVAKVGDMPTRNHNGVAVMAPLTRQFRNFRCYMTPEEAEFLVESNENKRERAVGKAAYFYPAGFPVPVKVDYEAPLAPAVSTEAAFASDPGQSLAAKEQMERAAVAMAAQEKGSNSAMEGQLGKKAPAGVPT